MRNMEPRPGPSTLRAWRASDGLGRADVAARVGVTRQMVWKWEGGASLPSLELACALQRESRGRVHLLLWLPSDQKLPDLLAALRRSVEMRLEESTNSASRLAAWRRREGRNAAAWLAIRCRVRPCAVRAWARRASVPGVESALAADQATDGFVPFLGWFSPSQRGELRAAILEALDHAGAEVPS